MYDDATPKECGCRRNFVPLWELAGMVTATASKTFIPKMELESESLEFEVMIGDFQLELTQPRGFPWLESQAALRSSDFGRVFNFKEVCRHPVELVWAVKIARDKVCRVTIASL